MAGTNLPITTNPGGFRKANEFYTIELDNDQYIITEEVLLANVTKQTTKMKGWYLPLVNFLAFKGKRLQLQASSNNTTYRLSFIIEKNRLSVACSCATQVQKLCVHSYKVLQRLMGFLSTSDYFSDYAAGGLVKTALANRNFFEFRHTTTGLDVVPKKQTGFVHAITNAPSGINLEHAFSLPSSPPAAILPDSDVTLCYMILVPRKPYTLPFVLPVLGKYNKARTGIKSFGKFLSGIGKDHEHLHTPEQKLLHQRCFSLNKEVESQPGLFERPEEKPGPQPHCSSQFLEHWIRMLPLLHGQHVFTHIFWQYRYLRQRPEKQYTDKVAVAMDIPRIQFHLVEYNRYYQMKMEILINEKPIKNIEVLCCFLLEHESTVYLLRSFQDAAIVDWFASIGNKLTIFKEHFREFERTHLKTLKNHYTVKLKSMAASKK